MANPKQNSEQKATSPMFGDQQITYTPGEGGPLKTKWHGHIFHANIPKTVSNQEMIAQAEKNRFFHVGPFDPAKHTIAAFPETAVPKTSEQYRAHVIGDGGWAKKMESATALDAKWQAEEPLRIECEVGSDDIDYIWSILTPMRAELKKRDMAA
jgi:hypothetical protein